MPRISTLSLASELSGTDILVGTDVSDSNISKNFDLQTLAEFINSVPEGSGTIGYIPKFNSEITVDNSPLFSSGDNIGLGTTSPNSRLHILSDGSSVSPVIRLEQSGSGDSSIEFLITGSNLWRIGVDNDNSDALTFARGSFGAGLTTMVLRGDNVGIGVTNPQHNIDLEGTAKFTDASTNLLINGNILTGSSGIVYKGDEHVFQNSSGSESFRINSSGNVGIGLTNPAYDLDVDGDIHTNSSLKITGTLNLASISYNDTNGLSITPPDGKSVLIGSTGPGNTNSLIVEGDVQAQTYSIPSFNTAPSSATDTGSLGEIRYTSDHLYICVATNTWKRSEFLTFPLSGGGGGGGGGVGPSENNYLTGITKNGNTLNFAVLGTDTVSYTFGSNAFTSITALSQLTNDITTITTAQADAIVANTSKISYPAADSAKVANISVTQPVDLDAMESAINAAMDRWYFVINNDSPTSNTTVQQNDTVSLNDGNAISLSQNGGIITINHADTSSQGSVDNSDGNVIQDVTLDAYGHITSLSSTDLDTRYLRATNLNSGNAVSLSQNGGIITINHADTSSQGSVDNSNGNVIQDVTLDAYGHITSLASTDLDTRYLRSTNLNSGNAISLSQNGSLITINHADTSSQGSVDNSNGNVIQDVTLDAYGHITSLASTDLDARYLRPTSLNNGNAISLSQNGGIITINHADTSSQGSVDNSNGNVIQDVALDSYGHITSLSSTDLDTRYLRPTSLNNGNAISLSQTGTTVTISHADTSSQGSVNNSNGNVIQDVILDAYGHITSLSSTDLDTRYLRKDVDTSSSGTITAYDFQLSSDKSLKENVESLNKNIDVDWVEYNFKDKPEQKRFGVIAQDLEEKYPEFVNDSENGKTVSYIDLLVAKIAELERRVIALENGCK